MSTHSFANMLGPDLYHTHKSFLRRLFYSSKHSVTRRQRAELMFTASIYLKLLLSSMTIGTDVLVTILHRMYRSNYVLAMLAIATVGMVTLDVIVIME